MVNKRAVQPGDEVQDLVTNFKGIATHRTTWLHGCDRIGVTPAKLGTDGTPIKEQVFDEHRLKITKAGKVPFNAPADERLTRLPIGAEAKDVVTGFTGIIAALTVTLGGDIHVLIEPEKTKKDGDCFDTEGFNDGRVEIIKAKPIPMAKPKKADDPPGGPQRGEGARVR
jgi:hypothetical protein